MSVAERKENIIAMLKKLQNKEAIEKLEKLMFRLQFEESSKTQMSDAEFKAEMQISFNDFKEGNLINSEDLLNQISRW